MVIHLYRQKYEYNDYPIPKILSFSCCKTKNGRDACCVSEGEIKKAEWLNKTECNNNQVSGKM